MIRVLLPLPHPAPERARVEGAPFHHLVHVLRLARGAELEVFDGHGRAFHGRLEAVEDQFAVVSLSAKPAVAATHRAFTVVQALPKADKLEWILQKGTELGASAFAPVTSARSVVRLSADRVEPKVRRWSKIVEEAARQCGRSDVPAVLPVRPLLEAVRALPEGTRVLVLDEGERARSLGAAFASLPVGAGVALVVGPEGGLEPSEREGLLALGAEPTTLGPRILRTETASLAALSVLLHLDGALG